MCFSLFEQSLRDYKLSNIERMLEASEKHQRSGWARETLAAKYAQEVVLDSAASEQKQLRAMHILASKLLPQLLTGILKIMP